MNWTEASMQADDEAFAEAMKKMASPRKAATTLIKEAAEITDHPEEDIWKKRTKQCVMIRTTIFKEMHRLGYSMTSIGEAFDTDSSTICHHLNKENKRGK